MSIKDFFGGNTQVIGYSGNNIADKIMNIKTLLESRKMAPDISCHAIGSDQNTGETTFYETWSLKEAGGKQGTDMGSQVLDAEGRPVKCDLTSVDENGDLTALNKYYNLSDQETSTGWKRRFRSSINQGVGTIIGVDEALEELNSGTADTDDFETSNYIKNTKPLKR